MGNLVSTWCIGRITSGHWHKLSWTSNPLHQDFDVVSDSSGSDSHAENICRNVSISTFWHVRPTKTQISLCIRAIWSESSNVPSDATDQTARMYILIWISAGRTCAKVRFLTFQLICIVQERNIPCCGGASGHIALFNVILTSMQRHDVASTLMRRCMNVMCSLGWLWTIKYLLDKILVVSSRETCYLIA